MLIIFTKKKLTTVIPKYNYTLKYSAADALMYLTKYYSKTFLKFKMQSKANTYFFGMTNDHNSFKPKVYDGS